MIAELWAAQNNVITEQSNLFMSLKDDFSDPARLLCEKMITENQHLIALDMTDANYVLRVQAVVWHGQTLSGLLIHHSLTTLNTNLPLGAELDIGGVKFTVLQRILSVLT